MVNKKSLATFVRTVGNQVISGFKHFLNNVKIGGDLIHDPDPLGSTATNLLTVDAQGVVRKATSLAGATGTVTSVALTAPSAFTVTGSPITSSGTIAIGAAGTAAQYVRGDGSLQTFPSLTGFVPYVGATTNVNLGTHTLLSRDIVINHSSGSGIAASITKNGSGAAVSIIKDGSGEGLTVVKGSGSGNAASITGGVTLISELHLTTSLADSYISSSANWNAAYNDKINSAAVTGTTTKTLTLTQQDGGTITASWTDINTDAVTSVFGRTGAVVATSGDYTTAQVTESGNLYFTNARGIGSTLTGYASGAGVISSADTILSAIQKLNGNIGALVTGVSSVNGLSGAVTLTTTNIAEGTNLYYTEARVNANTNVAANTAARHNAVTIGTANGLSLSTQVLSLGLASASTTGALSSTDWTTFNSKQNALTNPITGTGTTNYLPKFTGTTTLGNSQIFDNGTNVGIGTTSPNGRLQVNQGTDLNVAINTVTNDSVTVSRISSLNDAATASAPLVINANRLVFTTDTVEQMRITSAGNVGIGTTSPATKLHVAGTQYISGDLRIGSSFGATNQTSIFKDQGAAGLGIFTWGDTAPVVIGGGHVIIRSESGANRNLYVTGNVGIGTTAPGQLLQVNGGSLLVNTGTSATAYRDIMIGGIGGWSGGESHGIDTVYNTASSPTTFSRIESHFDGTNGKIRFRNLFNASAPRTDILMTIQGDGNVGIGTDSPGYKLDVVGESRFGTGAKAIVGSDGTYGGYSTVGFGGTTNGYNRVFGHQSTGDGLFLTATTGQGIDFWTNGVASSKMRITAAGNVGIGTTSPARLLHILAATGVDAYARIEGGLGGYGGFLELMSNSGGSSTDSAGKIDFYMSSTNRIATIDAQRTAAGANYGTLVLSTANNATTPTERMRITAAGNVGIGTTSPAYLLDVNGTFRVTGSSILSQRVTGTEIGVTRDGSDSVADGPWFRWTNAAENRQILTQLNASNGVTTWAYNGSAWSSIYTLSSTGAATFSSSVTAGGVDGGTAIFAQRAGGVNTFALNTNADSSFTLFDHASGSYTAGITQKSGNVGIGTTNPSGQLSGTKGLSIVDATNAALGLSNGTNHWLNYLSGTTYRIWNNTSNEVVTILLNGNVGIGTTSPGQKLEVNGNIIATPGNKIGFRYDSNDATLYGYITRAGAGGVYPLTIVGGLETGSTTIEAIRFETLSAGTARMSILNNGNVGIGTTAPKQKLIVEGTLATKPSGVDGYYSYLRSNWSQDNAFELGISDDGANTFHKLITSSDYYFGSTLQFWTSDTEKMRITSAGNVGIGTTSPNAKLSVDAGAGTPAFNNGISILTGNGTYTSGHGGILQFQNEDVITAAIRGVRESGWGSGMALYTHSTSAGNTFGTTVVERMRITEAGNVGIGTDGAIGKLSVKGTTTSFELDTDANGSYLLSFDRIASAYKAMTLRGGEFIFSPSDVEKVRITNAGNVGIGTTSPARTLNISSAGTLGTQVQINGTVDSAGIKFIPASGDNYEVQANNSSQWFVYNRTDEAYRLLIDGSGNVGIGTTSPSAKLNVSGDIHLGDYGSASVRVLDFRTSNSVFEIATNGTSGALGTTITYSWANGGQGPLKFNNAAGEVMRLSPTGNVGIGTTSPGAKLHVVGEAYIQGTECIFQTVNNTTGYLYFDHAGTQVWKQGVFNDNTSTFSIGNGGGFTRLLNITNGGNVGIGITSPSYKLSVNGAIGIEGSEEYLYFHSSANVGSNARAKIRAVGAGGGSGYGGDLRISTRQPNNVWNEDAVVINSSGNVGIGTTSPVSISGYTSLDINNATNGGLIQLSRAGVGFGQLYNNASEVQLRSIASVPLVFGTNSSEKMRITSAGNVGIGTTSPSVKLHVEGRIYAGDIGIGTTSPTQKLHVVGNARITGWIVDSLNTIGNPGDVLTSTSTGIEWLPGGGGGGGTTITVKEEGTTVSSSISTLNFVGSNVNATASGSTATISVRDNVGTGSLYLNDISSPYVIPGSYTDTVNINATDLIVVAPNSPKGTETVIAILTFGLSNITGGDRFNAFYFRLYNASTATPITDTEHRWSSYMSVDEPTTVATFHIPIKINDFAQGDDIYVQCQTSVLDAPEIYYCALSLIKGTE